MTSPIPKTPLWQAVPQPANPHIEHSTNAQINSVAVSSDGARVVLGTGQEFAPGIFHVFCYDGNSTGTDVQPLWSKPVSEHPIYQGVFWVDISDSGQFAAAGGEVAKDGAGFLFAYDVEANGAERLSDTLPSRVNQLALDSSGYRLFVCCDAAVYLYAYVPDANSYQRVDTYPIPTGFSADSATLSRDGSRAVIAAIKYLSEPDGNTTTEGIVIALDVSDSGFSLHQSTTVSSGAKCAAITTTGDAWGASLHDGSCVCFRDAWHCAPAWHFVPDFAIDISYAFAINGSTDDGIQVAYGANLPDGGTAGGITIRVDDYIGEDGQLHPFAAWTRPVQYGVNPGVHLDAAATMVTATDGKPESATSESAGNFYLIDFSNGELFWDYPTSMMNWPMNVTPNGKVVVGASDNGTVFYWAASS